MPILDITLYRPLQIALTKRFADSSGETSGTIWWRSRERLEREVGMDRLRAVAREQREMVHLARRTGLDDEPVLVRKPLRTRC